MEKDVNGTWCVVRILNLKEYIIERKTLLIKEYTE
ncbi:unknown [Dialister sp. CAG:588]|nr:unknown [Dialister sp. CAG:588]